MSTRIIKRYEMTYLNSITGGGRIYYIDVAKVIATFLVVFAHMYDSASSVRLYIYSFHMPFFFFVSGLFFKPKTIREEVYNTTKKLIIPAFLYILIAGLFFMIINNISALLSG